MVVPPSPSGHPFLRRLTPLILGAVWMLTLAPALGQPAPEDLPEEVLRGEIITEARSPLDGQPLTATEYLELEEALALDAVVPPRLSPRIRTLIFLLRLRKFLRPIFPFIP